MTLSAPAKKYLHGLVNTAAAAGATFLTYSVPTLIHIPMGVKGILVGLAVGISSKVGGYILGQVVQTTGETPTP